MVTGRFPRVRPAGLLLAAVLLSGCSSGVPMAPTSSDPGSATPAGSPTPTGWPSGRPPLQTMPPLPSGTPAEVSGPRWQAILDDLAGRQVAGTPTVVSAEAITWPDSSLGCPSPGVMYTQALVDGMRVVVEAGGARYDYRFGSDDKPKLCQR